MDVRAIREAIASDASSAAGVTRTFSFIPDKLNPRALPAVVVGNPSIDYNRTFGDGHATLTLSVWAIVSAGPDSGTGTAALDGFVSEQLATSGAGPSLATAIRQRAAIDERPWTVALESAAEYTLLRIESIDYYAVELTVTVRT